MLQVYRDPLLESNCYVIAEEGHALIIDPNSFEGIEAILKRDNLKPELVMLTHEHCDHMAGMTKLRQHYPVKVVASRACSAGIQSKKDNMSALMEVYLHFRGVDGVHYDPFVCAPADEEFEGVRELNWRGHHFKLCEVPGHTKGSVCIFWNDNSLFSGDYLIPGEEVITRLPGGDTEAYETIGKKWLANLKPGIQIYPGHNESFRLTAEAKREYGL